MATAITKPVKWIHERVNGTRPERVDEHAGVIFGVKLIGVGRSGNGYDYSHESLKRAAGKYENVPVALGHTARPGAERNPTDRIGRIVRVRVKPDGLYGDLELLQRHPYAGAVLEMARKMPGLASLSHEAKVRWTSPSKTTVECIEEVAGCDLVTRGATTKTLFESQRKEREMETFEQLAAGVWGKPAKRRAGRVREQEQEQEPPPLEEPPSEEEIPYDATAAGADVKSAELGGIYTAIRKAADATEAGQMSVDELETKVMELCAKLREAEPEPEPALAAAESRRRLAGMGYVRESSRLPTNYSDFCNDVWGHRPGKR